MLGKNLSNLIIVKICIDFFKKLTSVDIQIEEVMNITRLISIIKKTRPTFLFLRL